MCKEEVILSQNRMNTDGHRTWREALSLSSFDLVWPHLKASISKTVGFHVKPFHAHAREVDRLNERLGQLEKVHDTLDVTLAEEEAASRAATRTSRSESSARETIHQAVDRRAESAKSCVWRSATPSHPTHPHAQRGGGWDPRRVRSGGCLVACGG